METFLDTPPWTIALNLACLGAFGLLLLAAFGIWVWALVDCLRNEPGDGNDKTVWTLVILFLHGLGGALYLLVRRPQRIREVGH